MLEPSSRRAKSVPLSQYYLLLMPNSVLVSLPGTGTVVWKVHASERIWADVVVTCGWWRVSEVSPDPTLPLDLDFGRGRVHVREKPDERGCTGAKTKDPCGEVCEE